MTNAQINLEVAVRAMDAKLLNLYELEFVNSIKDFDKYDLRKLTPKQYKLLNSIYKKYKDYPACN